MDKKGGHLTQWNKMNHQTGLSGFLFFRVVSIFIRIFASSWGLICFYCL